MKVACSNKNTKQQVRVECNILNVENILQLICLAKNINIVVIPTPRDLHEHLVCWKLSIPILYHSGFKIFNFKTQCTVLAKLGKIGF